MLPSIRINPLRQYGGIPTLDEYIIRPADTNRNPSRRYMVNGQYHRNLTEARQAVVNWKGVDVGTDLYSVVEYSPGLWREKRRSTHPKSSSVNKDKIEKRKEAKREYKAITKYLSKQDEGQAERISDVVPRYEVSLGNSVTIVVHSPQDLEDVLFVVKKLYG